MVITQHRPRRKETGYIYRSYRKKRNYEKGNAPVYTKLGEKKIRTIRTRGNNNKSKYLQADMVNLFDKNNKTYHRVKINMIVENEANRHFVRRNVLTKGTIINTEKGKARITSRPGQHGTINAVLV
ncbi:MAG: 30S ribosomal protein S8e [Candidatus Woesearchaeota archaeon]